MGWSICLVLQAMYMLRLSRLSLLWTITPTSHEFAFRLTHRAHGGLTAMTKSPRKILSSTFSCWRCLNFNPDRAQCVVELSTAFCSILLGVSIHIFFVHSGKLLIKICIWSKCNVYTRLTCPKCHVYQNALKNHAIACCSCTVSTLGKPKMLTLFHIWCSAICFLIQNAAPLAFILILFLYLFSFVGAAIALSSYSLFFCDECEWTLPLQSNFLYLQISRIGYLHTRLFMY